MTKNALIWTFWGLGTLAGALWLGETMTSDATQPAGGPAVLSRVMFLPGQTTVGHYQIELACNVCHTPMQGVKQNACIQCHGSELEAADDAHPPSKFTDPRNADRVKVLDARSCIACHVEHRQEITRPIGVTMPMDYCVRCHDNIATERPTHAGLDFKSCTTVGCHNYHDNRALHETFLVKHLDDPDHLPAPRLPVRPPAKQNKPPLNAAQHDAPKSAEVQAALLSDWATTGHAQAGVNCTACHAAPQSSTSGAAASGAAPWTDTPNHDACRSCHASHVDEFLASRHGMRLAAGLGPMTPGMARQPMKPDAAHKQLSCVSCHSDHRFDVKFAAVDACISCHDDGHTRAYVGSPHHKLWLAEATGQAPAGSGVSCASCHMPRQTHRSAGRDTVATRHNPNDNLRPNEKMARDVCVSCHGLGFTLNALADDRLIRNNFTGSPAAHVDSLEMVKRKRAAAAAQKK